MAQAWFRFYAELNELLRPGARFRDLPHVFNAPASVKDRIEAQGIPHTEASLILMDGEPVDFSHPLQDGARVSVYPFLAQGPSPLPLRPPHPRGRFVLDQHLARLAAYLRLLGQDVVHRADFPDPELVRVAVAEQRVLLTRDKGVLMRREVVHGGFVRATDPQAQVVEVLHRFGAPERIAPFSRCLACNGRLEAVARSAVAGLVPAATLAHYERFWRCPGCARVFWEGPHVRRMRAWVETWLAHPDVPKPAGLRYDLPPVLPWDPGKEPP